MNNRINFNIEVNKYLKDKFKKEKWSGTSPTFYKNDVTNLVKCIKIERSLREDNFSCSLVVYSNFKFANSPKPKYFTRLHRSQKIFSVALTPNKVTSSSYYWSLKDDKDFNNAQIHLLWEAIKDYGNSFFNRFNSFPEPFLNIRPEDFDSKDVKLFNEYDVFNQIDYMNFLKEVHLSVDQIEKATAFSNLAIEQFHKNIKGKRIMGSKAYNKTLNEYLNFLEMP